MSTPNPKLIAKTRRNPSKGRNHATNSRRAAKLKRPIGRWSTTMWNGPKNAAPGGCPAPTTAAAAASEAPACNMPPRQLSKISGIALRRGFPKGFMDTQVDAPPIRDTHRNLVFAETALNRGVSPGRPISEYRKYRSIGACLPAGAARRELLANPTATTDARRETPSPSWHPRG